MMKRMLLCKYLYYEFINIDQKPLNWLANVREYLYGKFLLKILEVYLE